MLVVRAAGPADIDAMMELASLSGRGFTSLPEDRTTLSDRLALSEASFANAVQPREAWYTLMLEDSETSQIQGVASVKGCVDIARPHFSFRVLTLAQYSRSTETRFDQNALVLVNECSNMSEVGSLFLRPDKRQKGAGTLLARSRYMLIGAQRDRFCDTIMAELRGWFDDFDNSPFWDGIASKFFRLPFADADQMIASTDGQFILDLAPRHPLYTEIMDAAARKAIGAVHRQGVAALKLLEKEGFEYGGLIDIFDGGPTMTCRRDAIRTISDARMFTITIGDVAADAQVRLVSNDRIAAFRAMRAPAVIDGDIVKLGPEAAALLGLAEGATVQIS